MVAGASGAATQPQSPVLGFAQSEPLGAAAAHRAATHAREGCTADAPSVFAKRTGADRGGLMLRALHKSASLRAAAVLGLGGLAFTLGNLIFARTLPAQE